MSRTKGDKKTFRLGLDQYSSALIRHTFEAQDLAQDQRVWKVLVDATMADERDYSKLPLPFVERCIVMPLLWASDMLPERMTNKSRKFIAEYASEWIAKQKRRPFPPGRPIPNAKLRMLVVAAACAEDPRETVLSDRKYYTRIARRLNSTWYQVRRLHQKLSGSRTAGVDDASPSASDEILQRIAAVMRLADAEGVADAKTRKSGRHYQSEGLNTLLEKALSQAKDSRC